VSNLDRDVRIFVYRSFLDAEGPPTVEETAEALGLPQAEVEASYLRLDEQHVIALEPGTLDIWMANPFSARPTPFRVTVGERSFWGNCVWDALGIPAMLHSDGRVETSCADCNEPMTLEVAGGRLRADGVAHFAVPAGQWWDDIGHT
jgi:hypothetical protein